jgi:hypothetical protein
MIKSFLIFIKLTFINAKLSFDLITPLVIFSHKLPFCVASFFFYNFSSFIGIFFIIKCKIFQFSMQDLGEKMLIPVWKFDLDLADGCQGTKFWICPKYRKPSDGAMA